MDKLAEKAVALGVCLSVCFGVAGISYAKTRDEEPLLEPEVSEPVQEDVKTPSKTADVNIKDETVYVLANSDGTVKKVIVSDWIKNAKADNEIIDDTKLTDIKNVKGNETYSINGDHMKVWDAEGNDIYYQGSTTKALPVDVSVSYKLDGKTMSAKEIAGKSGRVTIRFDYKNNQYEMVDIGGKKEKIYVPFAMLTGIELDDDKFSNVEVTNGKVVNDGTRTVVAGLAFPGLQDNLAISKDKLEIPDYVEITADVKDFSLGMTVTIATNDLFNELDADKLNEDEVKDSMNSLTDAMDKLLDGSSKLYGGLDTLLSKSKELVDGIDKLAEGAKELRNGAASLDDGAGKIKSGISELSNGLNTLSSKSDDLTGGAKQVFNSLLDTATKQIQAAGISIPKLTISNYSQVLNKVIDSLDETNVYNQALDSVSKAVEANRDKITEKVTETVEDQVKTKVTQATKEKVASGVEAGIRTQVTAGVIEASLGMSKEEYDAAVEAGNITEEVQSQIDAAIEAKMSSDEITAKIDGMVKEKMSADETVSAIDAAVEDQMKSDAVKKTISDNVEIQIKKAIADNMASDAVQNKLKEASEGSKQIISVKTSLDSFNAFYLGVIAYTDGVDSAAKGASKLSSGATELKAGTEKLKSGSAQLYDGALKIKDGVPALVDGVSKLKDGSMKLSDGLDKLNKEGISKIVDLVDGDIGNTLDRLKATVDVSKKYKSFSGISDDMDGEVKLIYRTEEIKSEA